MVNVCFYLSKGIHNVPVTPWTFRQRFKSMAWRNSRSSSVFEPSPMKAPALVGNGTWGDVFHKRLLLLNKTSSMETRRLSWVREMACRLLYKHGIGDQGDYITVILGHHRFKGWQSAKRSYMHHLFQYPLIFHPFSFFPASRASTRETHSLSYPFGNRARYV